MAILSSLFSSSDSENSNSSDFLSVIDSSLGVDASHTSYEQSIDDDGSSHTSYDSSEFGTDLDFGSLVSNITDSFSSSDSDSGSFFG